MFSFLRSHLNLVEAGWMKGMSDIHCHLLPGVDDGSESESQTLEILSLMREAGVVRFVFTPHIYHMYKENTAFTLRPVFEKTSALFSSVGIPTYLGAEYMIDECFDERLADPLLLIGTSKRILVETSFATKPIGFLENLYKPTYLGAKPLLAHPERYLYFTFDEYDRFKDAGCEFQLNIFSLTGMYGPNIAKRAKEMLQLGYFDFIGTDTHKPRAFRKQTEAALLHRKYEKPIRELIAANDLLFV